VARLREFIVGPISLIGAESDAPIGAFASNVEQAATPSGERPPTSIAIIPDDFIFFTSSAIQLVRPYRASVAPVFQGALVMHN
jgi:hypothetical protein